MEENKSEEKKTVEWIIYTSVSSILLILFIFLVSYSLVSCTYSITMVHTEGTATDVVDEAASATADIKPDIKIPFTP